MLINPRHSMQQDYDFKLVGKETKGHMLKTRLNEVFDLFPQKGKYCARYSSYYKYLQILKTASYYIQDNAKILDVGIGSGVVPLVFRKMGYDVFGIDTWKEHSKWGIKEDIIERLTNNGIHLKYCNIEKEPLPFEDNKFDTVLFLDVIEHLHSSPQQVLKEIKRVLKLNGYIILLTPNLATLKNRICVSLGRSNHVELEYWYNSGPFFGHVREYTPNEIKKMLIWEGFEVKCMKLSNCSQIPIKQQFQLKPYTLIMMLYLLVTTFFPKFRYTMIVVGQKTEKV